MEKSGKKKYNIFAILIVVMSLMCVACIGFNIISMMGTKDSLSTTTGKKEKVNLYYSIKNNATDYQNELFNQLTDELNKEVDEYNKEEIVSLVAKSFVTDLFTWSNKDGNYDVGGIQYVYGDMHGTFEEYAKDTLYDLFDLYVSQYGWDYLPEVVSSTTNVFKQSSEYETNFGSYPYYYVYISWQYKDYTAKEGSDSKVVDTKNWINAMDLYVVEKEDGRFEVVEFYSSY